MSNYIEQTAVVCDLSVARRCYIIFPECDLSEKIFLDINANCVDFPADPLNFVSCAVQKTPVEAAMLRACAIGKRYEESVRPMVGAAPLSGVPTVQESRPANLIFRYYQQASYYSRLLWIYHEFEQKKVEIGTINGWPIFSLTGPIMTAIPVSQLQFDLRSALAFCASDRRFCHFFRKYQPADVADAILRYYGASGVIIPVGFPVIAPLKIGRHDETQTWKLAMDATGDVDTFQPYFAMDVEALVDISPVRVRSVPCCATPHCAVSSPHGVARGCFVRKFPSHLQAISFGVFSDGVVTHVAAPVRSTNAAISLIVEMVLANGGSFFVPVMYGPDYPYPTDVVGFSEATFLEASGYQPAGEFQINPDFFTYMRNVSGYAGDVYAGAPPIGLDVEPVALPNVVSIPAVDELLPGYELPGDCQFKCYCSFHLGASMYGLCDMGEGPMYGEHWRPGVRGVFDPAVEAQLNRVAELPRHFSFESKQRGAAMGFSVADDDPVLGVDLGGFFVCAVGNGEQVDVMFRPGDDRPISLVFLACEYIEDMFIQLYAYDASHEYVDPCDLQRPDWQEVSEVLVYIDVTQEFPNAYETCVSYPVLDGVIQGGPLFIWSYVPVFRVDSGDLVGFVSTLDPTIARVPDSLVDCTGDVFPDTVAVWHNRPTPVPGLNDAMRSVYDRAQAMLDADRSATAVASTLLVSTSVWRQSLARVAVALRLD